MILRSEEHIDVQMNDYLTQLSFQSGQTIEAIGDTHIITSSGI